MHETRGRAAGGGVPCGAVRGESSSYQCRNLAPLSRLAVLPGADDSPPALRVDASAISRVIVEFVITGGAGASATVSIVNLIG